MFGKELGQLVAAIMDLILLLNSLRGDVQANTEQLKKLNGEIERIEK